MGVQRTRAAFCVKNGDNFTIITVLTINESVSEKTGGGRSAKRRERVRASEPGLKTISEERNRIMRRNNNLTPKSMEALAKEWEQRLKEIPRIKEQLNNKADDILSSESVSDDSQNALENAFQCVMDSLEYYPSKIRTYIKRCAKLPDMETPENIEIYKKVRDEADQIIGQIEDMKETFYRQIQFRNLAKGVYFPLQNCKEIEIPPAPDEENE